MQITNSSSVHAPLETLWQVLNDVERVAPYVPGFELQEVDGDSYRGTIKVKVGAVTVAYNAEIEVLERDVEGRRVLMSVSGRERRGPGSMNASVTSVLSPAGESTEMSLTTDLQVTGRVAQFGSGVLADVSGSLLTQFVQALEQGLIATRAETSSEHVADSSASAPAAPPRAPVSDVVDITAVAGWSVAKRIAPQAAAAVLIAVVFYLLGRRR